MTTLVNTSNKGPSGKKKGRSKKAHVLAASVEQATQNFLEKGEQIAKESQDLKEELIAAVEDVRKQGRPSNVFQREACECVSRGFLPRISAYLVFPFPFCVCTCLFKYLLELGPWTNRCVFCSGSTAQLHSGAGVTSKSSSCFLSVDENRLLRTG